MVQGGNGMWSFPRVRWF
uniref:Uncharacterized protein n=1 Tax=Anguilla anguilla TaxID=7936 RepID=A0A0E9TPY1_ANGAN